MTWTVSPLIYLCILTTQTRPNDNCSWLLKGGSVGLAGVRSTNPNGNLPWLPAIRGYVRKRRHHCWQAYAAPYPRVTLASVVQRFKVAVVPDKDPGFEVPFLYDTTITFPQGVHITAIARGVPLGAEQADRVGKQTEHSEANGEVEGEGDTDDVGGSVASPVEKSVAAPAPAR